MARATFSRTRERLDPHEVPRLRTTFGGHSLRGFRGQRKDLTRNCQDPYSSKLFGELATLEKHVLLEHFPKLLIFLIWKKPGEEDLLLPDDKDLRLPEEE